MTVPPSPPEWVPPPLVSWDARPVPPSNEDTALLERALSRRYRLRGLTVGVGGIAVGAAAYAIAPVATQWSPVAALLALAIYGPVGLVALRRWERHSYAPAADRILWYRSRILTEADALLGAGDRPAAEAEAARLPTAAAWDRWRADRARRRVLDDRSDGAHVTESLDALSHDERCAADAAATVEEAAERIRAGRDWMGTLLAVEPDLAPLGIVTRRRHAPMLLAVGTWLTAFMFSIAVAISGPVPTPHDYSIAWGVERPAEGRFARPNRDDGAQGAIAAIDSALPAARELATVDPGFGCPTSPAGACPIADWRLTSGESRVEPRVGGIEASRVYALFGDFAMTGRARVFLQYGADEGGTIVAFEIDAGVMQRALDLMFPN